MPRSPAGPDAGLFTPDFKPTPYWWDRTPPPGSAPAQLPKKVDVAIIGSGYTGLNAALQLARGGRSTLVLDKETVGFGCSTRNGGQVGSSIKPHFSELKARHGEAKALAILQEGHRSLAWLGEFIAAEKIDCDYRVSGRLHAAHTPRAFEALASSVKHEPPGIDTAAEIVARTDQRREIGTDAYFGGVVYTKHAALDPARYHLGLLERARSAGATIVGNCEAQSIARDGSTFRVKTTSGEVEALNVVVATNGYTGALTPWLKRRIIPIGSYIIATEPLPRETMDRLFPTDRMVTDTRKVVYYYRASPDRTRILFGGRVSWNETDTRRSAARLKAELARLFPEISKVRVSHSWMGFVAYTFDTLMHTGEHEGVHHAAGYCGSGVGMASYLGMKLGLKLLGQKQGATAFDQLSFPSRPYYFGYPWFLAPAIIYYRWQDGRG